MGGGNVVQAGATLKEGDLQKNGVASVEAIYDLVYNGKGKMPGYGAGCAPKVRVLCRCNNVGAAFTEKPQEAWHCCIHMQLLNSHMHIASHTWVYSTENHLPISSSPSKPIDLD